MATYWAFPPQTFTAWDANGDPVPGAKAYIYEAGTSTPLTVYTDTALTTPHTSPIVADANGVFAPMYVSGPDELKINITDSSGTTLPGYPVDNITGIPVGGLTASAIAFTPTATLAATDVQTALVTLDTLTQSHEQRLDWLNEVETAGSSNAYTLDASGTVSAYASGQIFILRADRDNTGAATLNVDGLGARAIKKHNGTSYVDVASGDIKDGSHYWVEYDGTAFNVIFEQNAGTSGSTASLVGEADGIASLLMGDTTGWTLVETTYDFAVDGAVATVETAATLAAGYEYLLLGESLSHSSAGIEDFEVHCYLNTAAAYAEIFGSLSTTTAAEAFDFAMIVREPAVSAQTWPVVGGYLEQVTTFKWEVIQEVFYANTADTMTKFRFRFDGVESTDAGTIKLYRRAI